MDGLTRLIRRAGRSLARCGTRAGRRLKLTTYGPFSSGKAVRLARTETLINCFSPRATTITVTAHLALLSSVNKLGVRPPRQQAQKPGETTSPGFWLYAVHVRQLTGESPVPT